MLTGSRPKRTAFTALLPYCPTALLPYCPTALVPYCATALLPYCPTSLLPYCPTALLPYCPTALLPYCPTALEIESPKTQINAATAARGRGPRETPFRVFPRGIQTQTCCSQENTMRHADFAPLYRSTVGFDRLFS